MDNVEHLKHVGLAVANLQTTYGWLHYQGRYVKIKSQVRVAERSPREIYSLLKITD